MMEENTDREHACPISVTLDLAEELAAEYAAVHPHPDSARGDVCITRRILAAAQRRFPCNGAVLNDKGYYSCPIGAIVNDTSQLGLHGMPYEAFLPDAVELAEPGQFL